MNRHLNVVNASLVFAVALGLFLNATARADDSARQLLRGHVPSVVAKSQLLGQYAGTNRLKLAISLPFRDQAGLSNLLGQLYDPNSPNYHHYLTAPQFADHFGPTAADYERLKTFAISNNLNIIGTHPNRMLLDVEGAVSDIEQAFHVKMQVYHHPTRDRNFYAPDTEPSIELDIPVLHISGLDNYVMPHPLSHRISDASGRAIAAGLTRSNSSLSGSGPGQFYFGSDFRNAYAPGVSLTGTGQNVALFEYDGYFDSDIIAYEQQAGLPNVNLVNVPVDGGVGVLDTNDPAIGEVSLDIEMVIAMAPGVSTVFVYESPEGPADDILNRMATDNSSKQISSSWVFGSDSATDQIFQELAAQGQTFYQASGDSDAYVGAIAAPEDDPYITLVGGTELVMNGAGYSYSSESVWNNGISPPGGAPQFNNYWGSGGGISTTFTIPTWQQGINMATNLGSTNYRNLPDVALTADNIWVITGEQSQTGAYEGTSCAAPLWAGFTALINQQAAANGESAQGFINPAIYAIGKGPTYLSCFHDTIAGNNTWSNSPTMFYAVPGYDLCTGWGTPNGSSLINTLAPVTNRSFLVVATNIITGGNGNGIVDSDECDNLTIVLTNEGTITASDIQATLISTTVGVIVVQGTSAYPDLAPNTAATNPTLFNLSTEPNFVCGAPVNLALVLKTAQKVQTNFIQLPSGTLGSPVTFSSQTFTPIPSSGIPVNSPVVVSGLQEAGKVTVSICLTNEFDYGMTLQLVSPGGASVILSQGVYLSGFGQDYGENCSARTTFDDAASLSINSPYAISPYVGSFQPQQPLSAFKFLEGTNLNGTWNLRVINGYSGDSAALECWSLNISPEVCVDGGGTCPGSDVSLAMSVNPTTVIVGSNAVFSLVVSNAGPSAAQNVTVSQGLPAGVTGVTVLNNGIGSVQTSSNLSLTLGTLPVYGSQTVQVSMTFTANTLGQNLTTLVTSAATVSSSSADPNLNNNAASAQVLVTQPTADLAVTMGAAPTSVLQGALVTYTISVTNNGPSMAKGVTLSTTLPTGANFVSAAASQGTVTFNGTFAQLGDIPIGTNVTVTIVVSPTLTGNDTASTTVALGAGAGEIDPDVNNNSAAVIVAVGPAADLGISAVASPSPVLTGGTIGYIVTVSNNGPSAASSIGVNQSLPLGATGISSTLPTHTITGTQISGTIPSLASGASTNIINVVRSPSLAGGATSNLLSTFTVGGQPVDANSTNNTYILSVVEEPPTEAVAAAGAFIVSGTSNGAIGTNGTYNVLLYLQNAGNVPTTNLVATLQTNASLSPVHGSNTFTYGALAVGSAPVPGRFAFTVNSSNGATVSAVLKLVDGSTNLGTATFNFSMPAVQTFANTGLISIPTQTKIPDPDEGPANPYPSTIVVSNVSGNLSAVTVTVSNLLHTYPNDIGMLLVGPGTNCVLMSAIAPDSTMTSPVTITFDANANQLLPGAFDDLVSGVYLPGDFYQSQYGATETFPGSPAPVGPYNTNLAVFVNFPVNGAWSLYVEDDAFGNAGVISNGWSVSFTTITPVNQVADLAAAITASTSQVLLGGLVTNVWTITDNGPNAVTNVYVTNILSSGLALATNLLPSGTATIQSGATSIFNLGTLAYGASVTVTNVVVAGASGQQTNSIIAASSVLDPTPGNNSSSVVTTVNPPPVDLILPAISVSPSPAALGGNIVYTVGVTNNGSYNAYGVVGDFSMTGLSLNYAVIFPSSGTSYAQVGNTLGCNLGTIPPGGSAQVTIDATVTSSAVLTNTWTVTTTSANTNLANNSVSSHVTVILPVAIITNGSATLISQGGPPFNGALNNNQTNTLALTLLNTGNGATTNLVATLVANSSIHPITSTQSYGVIAPSGSAARNFTFAATGASGANVTAELSLEDGSNTNLGPAYYAFTLPGTLTFSNNGAITIPYFGPATPYPSSIEVSLPANTTVGQTSATLIGFGHSWPQDVEAALVSPGGQKVMLMEHTGEYYPVTNLTLTFSDSAAGSLPAQSTLLSGTFLPTEYSPFDTFPTIGAVPANSTNLNIFNGADASGLWSLYVYDDSQGNNGVIAGGWTLDLTTITPLAVVPTLAAAKVSAQSLQLTITGSPSLTYGVEVSTNLSTWTMVATNTTTGNFIYTDNFTNGPQRFYRAVQIAP